MTLMKGVSSMKPRRDIGVRRKAAWFPLHRVRAVFERQDDVDGGNGCGFSDPVEADETYVSGLEGNRYENRKLKAGRGGFGKSFAVAVNDRFPNHALVMSNWGSEIRLERETKPGGTSCNQCPSS